MLIDLTQHFVEILPHLAPTTLIVRVLDTATFRGEVLYTPGITFEEITNEHQLAPDASIPADAHPVIFEGRGGGYRDDGPSRLMEWKITRAGSYWIGSAYWELPQPDKDRPSIRFRGSQILIPTGATKIDLITDTQGEPSEWSHLRVHLADYNPNSSEPAPLSGEIPSLGRSIWERLDE